MILDPKKTTIGYRCPSCGTGVLAPVGVFSLSAAKMVLKCPCGESALTVAHTKNGQVHITVPCLVCGVAHPYTVSEEVFFGRDLFTLSCSMTGLELCFFGDETKVGRALKDQEDVLRDMVPEEAEEPLDGEDLKNSVKRMNNAEIYDVIKFLLMELEADGKITCACGTEGEYDLDCCDDRVEIYCAKCKHAKTYPIASVEDAQRFLEVDEIRL